MGSARPSRNITRRSRHRPEAEEKALLVDDHEQGALKGILVHGGMAVGRSRPDFRRVGSARPSRNFMRRSRHRLEAEEKATLVVANAMGALKVVKCNCDMAIELLRLV